LESAVEFDRSDYNLLRFLGEIIERGQNTEVRLSCYGKRLKFVLVGKGIFRPDYCFMNQGFINGIKNLKNPKYPINEIRDLCCSSISIEEKNRLISSKDSLVVAVVCPGWFLRVYFVRPMC
jgi:hypothetical protein